MKKVFLGLSLFTLSLTASAANLSVDQTLENIEASKNAECVYSDSSFNIAALSFRWHKEYYTCYTNGDVFEVSLRVREKAEYGQGVDSFSITGYKNPIVTNVSISEK